ncbi:MAG: hypothetical protein M0Z52_13425 [Actinomycetota bacterium]|nr:hypothetical protein [Actinomycetota bacterium]
MINFEGAEKITDITEIEDASSRVNAGFARIQNLPEAERGEALQLLSTMQEKLREARRRYEQASSAVSAVPKATGRRG